MVLFYTFSYEKKIFFKIFTVECVHVTVTRLILFFHFCSSGFWESASGDSGAWWSWKSPSLCWLPPIGLVRGTDRQDRLRRPLFRSSFRERSGWALRVSRMTSRLWATRSRSAWLSCISITNLGVSGRSQGPPAAAHNTS